MLVTDLFRACQDSMAMDITYLPAEAKDALCSGILRIKSLLCDEFVKGWKQGPIEMDEQDVDLYRDVIQTFIKQGGDLYD